MRIQRLKELAATAQQRLTDTRNRIEVLTVEAFSQMGERIDVISDGEDTSQISSGRARFATAGGVGGALLPIGLLALIGLLSRHCRSPVDAGPEA